MTSIPHKTCTKCGKSLPATPEFFQRRGDRPNGLRSCCKPCIAVQNRESLKNRKRTPESSRTCTKCKNIYPATSEFFHKSRWGKNGLCSHCKQCVLSAQAKETAPPDDYTERTCTKCDKTYPLSEEFFYRDKRYAYGFIGVCISCRAVYCRSFQRANRGRYAAYTRAYYHRNSADIRSKRREKYSENVEKSRQYAREGRKRAMRDPERRRRIRETARRHWANSPEYRARARVHGHNYRARLLNAEGTFTLDDVRRIRKQQRDMCKYCNRKLKGRGTVDHVIPLTRNGTNWPSNIVLACRPCNSSKHNKLLEEWDGPPHMW